MLNQALRRPLPVCQVQDGAQLENLINTVQQVDGVIKVVRGGMEELIAASSPAQFWANCHIEDVDATSECGQGVSFEHGLLRPKSNDAFV